MEIIGVHKSEENVKIKSIVNVLFDMVVLIAVVVCKNADSLSIVITRVFLVKCNKGASAGLICFNGGTCNNESESCVCRAGYQDQGSGCLLSSLEKSDSKMIEMSELVCRSLSEW